MNNPRDSSSSEWLRIARKDWTRIHFMLVNEEAAKYKSELETFRDLCICQGDVPFGEIIILCNQ